MAHIADINTRSPGDCGYVAGFGGRKVGIYAPTLYAAKTKALDHFKPRKRDLGLVWVTLAERADGSVVAQSTAAFG